VAGPGDLEAARIGARAVHRRGETSLDYALYRRESLGRGDRITGPAIVEEHTATTVLHTGDDLVVGEHGELVITVSPEE
jgi:N-methylhydantoinase A